MYQYAVPLIREAAMSAQRKWGGYLEDHIAEGNYIYIRALRTYVPGRTLFRRYLKHKLHLGLIEASRTERRQRHGLKPDRRSPVLNRLQLSPTIAKDGHWTDTLDSDDLLVIQKAIRIQKYGHHNKPIETLNSLRKFLRGLGWTQTRILESFSEIRKALQ